MPQNPQTLALLDPRAIGDSTDDPTDPRRVLLQQLSLSAMEGLNGEGGGGGGGGTDHSVLASDPHSLDDIQPAGFDRSTGLPTEFPATAAKNSAYDRQQDLTNPPQRSTGSRLLKAAQILAPAAIGLAGHSGAASAGAAQGAEAASQRQYSRGEAEKNRATSEYQFQAGQEMTEREQAMKEKIAMTQIDATKAYRNLMAAIANKKANTAEEKVESGETAAGYFKEPQPDGTYKLRPIQPNDLSFLKQAQLGLAQAQTELDDARTKQIPAMIAIAQKKVDAQLKMLQISLGKFQLSQNNDERQAAQFEINNGVTPSGGSSGLLQRIPGQPTADGSGGAQPIGLKQNQQTGPTAQSRNMAQMAATVAPHLDKLDALIDQADKAGYIGPAKGRVYRRLLAGEVGSTGDPKADRLLGNLVGANQLAASAMLRTHFGGRGAQQIMAKFQQQLSEGASAELLHGTLDEWRDYINSYSQMGGEGQKVSPLDTYTPLRRGGAAALQKTPSRKSSGATPAPTGGAIRDYRDVARSATGGR